MNERVTATIEGGVADVRLTRADKMNAVDDAMFDALIQTGERLKTEGGCARSCSPAKAAPSARVSMSMASSLLRPARQAAY